MSSPTWFITASSSGFGKYIALDALKRGHTVIATARSTSKIEDLKKAGATTLSLDVTDSFDNLKSIVKHVIDQFGRIDYLVNAAGYILEGALEEATPEETFKHFNTNVFGNLNVIRAVLPYMRAQKSGVIALFGSLGSWRSWPASSLYSGTKWACSGIAEGLHEELKPFGIDAFVIEPGYFRTGFLNPGARVSATAIPEYENSVVGEVRRQLTAVHNHQKGDVVKGARVIVDTMTKSGVCKGRDIPVRLVLGPDCDQAIREKCSSTIQLLDDWRDISTSTDHVDDE